MYLAYLLKVVMKSVDTFRKRELRVILKLRICRLDRCVKLDL